MKIVDICSMSGGKDSTATACLALERAEKTGRTPTFVFADTGNEHELTLAHIDYLEGALGHEIVRVKADFAARLEQRRVTLPIEWRKEKRRTFHVAHCPKTADCGCPVKIMPAVPEDLIERAVELMTPTGIPFLDLCILKGRFPSRRAQFCTEELKVEPINRLVHPMLEAGTNVVSWLGERAEESDVRAKKKALQAVRWLSGARLVLYRPIHRWTAAQVFEIARRRGLRPNPLYLQGMGRVGCMPCINCGKDELASIAQRFPEHIEKIRAWESLLADASRRGVSTFFSASMLPGLPGDEDNPVRASIDNAIAWARTDRGGRQFSLLQHMAAEEAARDGAMCESAYGLCE
jgi:3'-phosphoadenosine 5'-phosphosulfate sulfotransferase (PAPS reductase)/FAD synthetase